MNLYDLGCGKFKKEGWTGVDHLPLDGVDIVCDVFQFLKDLPENSADGFYVSHFVEHLESTERIDLFNLMFLKLKNGGVVYFISPDFSCASAYGDPTHKWPPISHWFFGYLDAEWRKDNAPHVWYVCNFRAEEIFKEAQENFSVICAKLKAIKEEG